MLSATYKALLSLGSPPCHVPIWLLALCTYGAPILLSFMLVLTLSFLEATGVPPPPGSLPNSLLPPLI